MPQSKITPSNLTRKIIAEHLSFGSMEVGMEIGLKIDQTLVHDATGQMAMLQFEALGFPKVTTYRSLIYCDHNILQVGYENADDHAFLTSCAQRFGLYLSKPGNGICHLVNLERFAVPGHTLLGGDSHTTTAGSVCELAIGAGGLDVAVAMGGELFYLPMPKICQIDLKNNFPKWISAKDLALSILKLLTVSGGRGKILEFTGEALLNLSIEQRATIANMSIETGAITAIFPSDERTLEFLASHGRESDYRPFAADPKASYDESYTIDLSSLEPLAAAPHSPDNVFGVSELKDIEVNQIAIGSCTNGSFSDLMAAATILKGRKVDPKVSLVVAPGSRRIFHELSQRGAISDLVASGARIVESACGFCNGVGQAPQTEGVALRTSNRNFPGRSGTASAKLYLVSPQTAAASALTGKLTDPRTLGEPIVINPPKKYLTDDALLIPPAPLGQEPSIIRGPNIQPLPRFSSPNETITGPVMLKLGDNITTDDILPAGAHILALRANIPAISNYIFSNIDPTYPSRQQKAQSGFIVAGANYGQGSSREHAALAPRYLGLSGVIAISFARIHKANLCNFGIFPLELVDGAVRDKIEPGHKLSLKGLSDSLVPDSLLTVDDIDGGFSFKVALKVSSRQLKMLLAGGLLAMQAANLKAKS